MMDIDVGTILLIWLGLGRASGVAALYHKVCE